jgi:hypothetical protein
MGGGNVVTKFKEEVKHNEMLAGLLDIPEGTEDDDKVSEEKDDILKTTKRNSLEQETKKGAAFHRRKTIEVINK